ncbi:MAG: DsbA family oxidoreductase [Pseudomonadota bacterium]
MIKLDILSDPICPWCMIGKAELEAALTSFGDHPFEIEWHPFQLNPEMPPSGMERTAYLEEKFGGAEGAKSAYAPIVERAEALGLDIAWDKISVTPNTLNAHRLIHWAGLEGRQYDVVGLLFDAYFQKGENIGDLDVLATISARAGMDRDVTLKLLTSDADVDDIRTRDAKSRERGVTGVPTFIVAGQYVLPGAQPENLWTQVLTELAEKNLATMH